jgi:leader peptidase (prepilin peptidase)/N-methyltransferase
MASLLLSPWAHVLAFAWGAIFGSFASVVIHRVPRGESIVRPRSRCPGCGATIRAWDNIPIVSYLVLRGRCRRCGENVPLRYLVIELLSGLLSFATFVLTVHLPLVSGGQPGLLAWQLSFAFTLALLVVIYVDLDFWIVPDAVVLPMAAVGVLAAVLAPDALGVGAIESVGAALLGAGLFVGIRWLYLRRRGIEALGLGDAKLLLMVGAFGGLRGLVWCIGAGAIQGLLVAVPVLFAGRRVANRDLREVHGDDPDLGEDGPGVMGKRVPFGPFLAVAALEYVLLRSQIDGLVNALTG